MPRWLKIILRVFLGIFVLLIAVGIGIAVYINTHKKELMDKITAQLSEEIIGTLTIEDISPELIRGFPAISVSLNNVLLRDSLYSTHGHDLLKANNVYVAVDAFSLLNIPRIRSVEASNGSIYLFTDSLGYSNTNIFRKRDSSAKKKNKPRIDHIYMRSMLFTFENTYKSKLFKLDVHDLEAKVDYNSSGWTATADLSAFVHSFAFNTTKGSYLKDKELGLDVTLSYDYSKQALTIPKQKITAGKDELYIGGTFDFSQTPGSFILNITADDILFKNAASLLSQNISSKLTTISLKEPVNVSATINGRMKFRDTPLVRVAIAAKNNTLTTPSGNIDNISFNGVFQNHCDTAKSYKDDNSRISMYSVKGVWENIPFTADSVQVTNLIRPTIHGLFRSQFPLTRLNPIIGGNTFTIKSGNADVNLRYSGGLLADDTTSSHVYGTIKVDGAAITYLPRNMAFTNTSAIVNLNGADIYIQKANVQCGTTMLMMSGGMRNFMNLYYNHPEKLLLDWNVASDRIDLREFISFLAVRKGVAATQPQKAPGNRNLAHISQQLDNVLAASSVHIKMQVKKLLHRNFHAENINADIMLEQQWIVLNKVAVDNAGGHMEVRGNISQNGPVNNFRVAADITNVRIPEFFKSFDNFGQDAITDNNLMGRLYANVDVTGSIRDTGSIIPNSFNGKVKFDVRDGALINFGPFLKVSKYVFRNRDLGNVRFASLKNTLEIKGDKIYIDPMMIESSAININVGGVYSLSTGTNIDIDIPLRNPKNDELILDDSMKMERNMKGIVIHLKATDGDDGNVKIKWMRKKQQPGTEAEPGDPDATPEKKKLGRRLRDKLKKK